jgi:molecular chaperone DnaK
MATSKEQSIQITASSGLSKAEIEKLIKDAELHVDEDRKKKELVEAKNHADTLIYTTEKSLKDLEAKVDAQTRSSIEAATADLKKAMEGSDVQEIQRLSEALTQASHKLAEAMYKQASAAGADGAAGPGPDGGPDAGGTAGDEDVVDADFEEVKDKK